MSSSISLIQPFQIIGEELKLLSLSWQYQLSAGRRHVLRKVLVNGTPKTGTMWMMRLLLAIPHYRSSGNFTGQTARYLRIKVGTVVHGHEKYRPEFAELLQSANFRVIVMLRDPRDQTVSRLYHIRRDVGHPFHAQLTVLNQEAALMTLIEGRPGLLGVRSAMAISSSWLDAGADMLCVRYEDLSQDPTRELTKVMQYLAIPADNRLTQAIIRRNRFERQTIGRRIWQRPRRQGEIDPASHFRKGTMHDWQNFFTPTHVDCFKAIAGQLLIDLGYETDLNWSAVTTPSESR